MRSTGFSYLRDLCVREDYLYSNENTRNRSDRFVKIDDFINQRLCKRNNFTQKQIVHLGELIIKDYVDFVRNSRDLEIYVEQSPRAEFCVDGKDVFQDRIRFCAKVLKEHEERKLNNRAVERKIDDYIKFRLCITKGLTSNGKMFMEVHTCLSYHRFCKKYEIENITITSTENDSKRRKRLKSSKTYNCTRNSISNKEYQTRSKTSGEMSSGESICSNQLSESPKNQKESDVFETYIEEDSKMYRSRQRQRVGVLFKEMKQIKHALLEMKFLNEVYEHPAAACARVEYGIADIKNVFEQKSTKILHDLEKIGKEIKQKDSVGQIIDLVDSPDALKINKFMEESKTIQILRDISINNDLNEKKGTGQYGIIMYSSEKPEHVGQISQFFNERNNGKEKELIVFDQKYWYKIEQLAIIQDYPKIMNMYDKYTDLHCETIIKSSNPDHVGETAQVLKRDFERSCVKLGFMKSGSTAWYHTQCLKRFCFMDDEDSNRSAKAEKSK